MEMTDNNRQCRTGLVPTLRAYYDVFFFSHLELVRCAVRVSRHIE